MDETRQNPKTVHTATKCIHSNCNAFFLKHSTNKSCYVQEFSDAQLTKCFIGNRAVCRVSFYNPEKPPLVSITSRWDKGENIRKFLLKTLWFGAVTGPSLCFLYRVHHLYYHFFNHWVGQPSPHIQCSGQTKLMVWASYSDDIFEFDITPVFPVTLFKTFHWKVVGPPGTN